MRRLALLAALLALAGCGPRGPRAVELGLDACTRCHMPLGDHRFAAQLVTRTGRSLVFDDAACLAAHLAAGDTPPAEVAGAWVADFRQPDRWVSVDSAAFVASAALRTPMGGNVAAVPAGPAADSLRAALDGSLLAWADVRSLPHARHP